MVVTGVNFLGLMPCSRRLLIEAATVFRDTISPSSRRSARIRGVPYWHGTVVDSFPNWSSTTYSVEFVPEDIPGATLTMHGLTELDVQPD